MAKEPDKKPEKEIAPNEPYPTGSPPDPMEEYYKANPERRPKEEEKAEDAPATEPAPAPEPKKGSK